jgi:CheY-like chemotaxis protein
MFGARTRGFTLAIRGYEYNDFGERLSPRAHRNLAAAVTFIEQLARDNGLFECTAHAADQESERQAATTNRQEEGKKGTFAMKDDKHVILCIDDDQDFRDSIAVILEGEGYVIETAESAEAGLKKFKQVNPDLVIVDLMMEEIDAGTQFVKEIKSLGSDVPIFMLSSVGDNMALATDYRDLGLSGVLQKPINPATLLSTLKAKLKA